jgi:glutamyl-tRNA synthetase
MSGNCGRYAPSPSGALHLGNLRTALLAWCFARSRSAPFLIRIEDLDPQRSRREHERSALADLERIGVDWDGPPVRQSERAARHREAFEALRADRHVYPCWCTRAEIREAASAPHGDLPEGAYPGTCRELTRAERGEREHRGRPAALRLRADGARVEVEDRLLGSIAGTVDDFVIRRGDGAFAYNLAVVVDDAGQAIGEVVRGADLADSTPRQVHLARVLGLAEAAYAHVPLVLGSDGQRLAKRHGAVTLADRAGLGETPDEARAWMARSLGLAEPGETPAMAELLERFDPERLPREPTVMQAAPSS